MGEIRVLRNARMQIIQRAFARELAVAMALYFVGLGGWFRDCVH